MIQEIKVPKLGDGIDQAEVIAILVAVGDTIEKNQALLELESDKASVEVPATAAGTIKSIALSAGDSVSEGQLILTLEAASESDSGSEPESKPALKPEATAANSVTEPTSDQPDSVQAEPEPDSQSSESGESQIQEIKVPKLGDGIAQAEVTAVLVAEGDTIEKNQTLIELESDKASVEVPSPAGGIIQSLAISEGDSVSEGQLILILKTAASAQKATEKTQPQSASEAPSQQPVSEKKSNSAESAESLVTDEPETRPSAPRSVEQPISANPVAAAPSVRRFARELGVNIQTVSGSGIHGRISEGDVKLHVKGRLQSPAGSEGGAASFDVPDLPDFAEQGPIEIEKLSNVRRATAKQMSLSWNQIPHVTQYDQADITELERFRKSQSKLMERAGGKLTVTAILLKVCAQALKQFPQFNASLDIKKEQIVYKKYYHIGVAVDTPRGLLVPVLQNADQKGLITLSLELNELAGLARDRKLSPAQMSGANFTISNLGGLGTTYFTPIVNWPQVAILGVGKATMQPVWQGESFEPRMMMPLSISYDHRLIDGANAARFLRWIAEALENPFTMMMQGENQ